MAESTSTRRSQPPALLIGLGELLLGAAVDLRLLPRDVAIARLRRLEQLDADARRRA